MPLSLPARSWPSAAESPQVGPQVGPCLWDGVSEHCLDSSGAPPLMSTRVSALYFCRPGKHLWVIFVAEQMTTFLPPSISILPLASSLKSLHLKEIFSFASQMVSFSQNSV